MNKTLFGTKIPRLCAFSIISKNISNEVSCLIKISTLNELRLDQTTDTKEMSHKTIQSRLRLFILKDPEWPSGLVPARHVGAPGSLPGRVGLSEINFSDLYCGWLGRIINVEYNTTH